MRTILWLAMAVGAVAVAGTSAAQSASPTNGHRGGPQGMAPAKSGHQFLGGVRRFKPGIGAESGRRHGRHHRRFGRGGESFAYPFGAGGIAGPFEAVDPHGAGFFGGGEVRSRGGRPYYDYDRAYPYQWASAAAGGFDRAGEEPASRSPVHCRLESGVRVCRGGR